MFANVEKYRSVTRVIPLKEQTICQIYSDGPDV